PNDVHRRWVEGWRLLYLDDDITEFEAEFLAEVGGVETATLVREGVDIAQGEHLLRLSLEGGAEHLTLEGTLWCLSDVNREMLGVVGSLPARDGTHRTKDVPGQVS